MKTGKDLFDWMDRELWGIEPEPETILVEAAIDVVENSAPSQIQSSRKRSPLAEKLSIRLRSMRAIKELEAYPCNDKRAVPIKFGELLKIFGRAPQFDESGYAPGRYYIWFETLTGNEHGETMFNITFFVTTKADTDYYDFTGYSEEGALRRLLSQFNVRQLSYNVPCVEFAGATWRG